MPTDFAHLDRTLLALSDPSRRGVVELLRQQPRRAGELAEALSMTPPAMSRHLRLLRKTGLVTESELEHDARVRVYRLQMAPFAELRSWLEQVEALWADQLGAFKAHAEMSEGGTNSRMEAVREPALQRHAPLRGAGTPKRGTVERGTARPKVGRSNAGRKRVTRAGSRA